MGDPSRAWVTGPLRHYAPGFVAELARLGCTANSASGQMFLMAHLGRWLAGEALDAAALTSQAAERFLAARRAAGYKLYPPPKAPGRCWATCGGWTRRRCPPRPLRRRLQRRCWAGTGAIQFPSGVLCRRRPAATWMRVRPFLACREGADALRLKDLTAGDVTAFVLAAYPAMPRDLDHRAIICRMRGSQAGYDGGLQSRRLHVGLRTEMADMGTVSEGLHPDGLERRFGDLAFLSGWR